MNEAESRGDVVDQLAEEFLARYRRGERPAVQEYAAKYPEQAAQIRDLFPALVALERVAPAGDSESVHPGAAPEALSSARLPEQLGDYRIVREIGRGGMGVVYEAEQQSLGRQVALKVLLRNAAQDPRLVSRFRRESRAAAQLHHTNIVPVFEVGQQDGLCYYAMQFIRGQALDAVFQELQHLRSDRAPGAIQEEAALAGSLADALQTGAFEPAGSACATEAHEPTDTPVAPVPPPPATPLPTAALPDRSELSSVASNYRRYCRNVARLGLQAAEALAYAHGRGIVHRDIKPANLLLDSTGVLWVSDFGLVKTQDPALTDTGDLVGTLRYMAPERFRGECDARADVYALGLTLYELLVLRPAFDGQDRLHLVDQIGHQEPSRPRVLDSRIPRDLETILMKAIEKEPRRRYPSAEALAGDLRRFLADEPIQARRIGPLERLGRWGRRNPLVAGLSAAVVLVTALGFAGVFGQMQEAKEQRDVAQQQRDEVRALNERLQRTLYAAHMNLAQHAWEKGDPERVRELLEQQLPKAGVNDLRGFEWYYLYRLSHAELLTLNGHTGGVVSVAISPDGKRLVSGSQRAAKVWDAQSGQELFTLKGHALVASVAFSPDGKRLASQGWAGNSSAVKVWDTQTGQELLSLKAQSDGFPGSRVVFSPDGKRLACAGNTWDDTKKAVVAGQVKVWDAQTGQELLSLKGHIRVGDLAFSPDGKRLASADDKMVKVWDAQTGQDLLTFKGHTGRVDSVAFSPDGRRLASSSDKEFKVWDAQTGQELLSLKGNSNSVVYSLDGKRLAGGQENGWVKVWDAQTGQELLSLKGHSREVTSVAFSADGKRLASASYDGTVKVWDAQTNQNPLTFPGAATSPVASVAFSPDGKRLASGGSGRPDSGPGVLKVWDAQTGQEIFTLKGHTANVTTVAYSPDGKRLASGAGDKMVKTWDAQTGQELLTLKGHTNQVHGVTYSPDGTRLASASKDNTVKVWDAQTGQELLALKHAEVLSVAFSPDGKRLASGSGRWSSQRDLSGDVKVWDAQTGQELLALKHAGVLSVAFSPDGKRLASAGGPEVNVWDGQTGEKLLSLKGHSRPVGSVAFSPDSKRLAGGGGGWGMPGEVKVWDAQTGQELLTVEGNSGQVNGVAFSPDSHRLAAGSNDGTVTIYDATPLPAKP
jgi:WD40 repeat protein/serine/threonine protein kinase